ncbi:hypothetical protein [Flavobacterium dankookense]|uniref:Lipoprotein n=1 Tax=Flavobacterium dankookense TaxID=706186 RepID=A0A4R6QD59_9FLAO|nr:hypothetical protein [Flavobacterium dankookense]TDP60734.1 hypothetical protein BC748_0333 [Flavobacterium dankookense]
MKKNILKYGVFFIAAVSLVSCKNKELEIADKKIASLESYVDSIEVINLEETETNWDRISSDFDRKNLESSDAISNLTEDVKYTSQAKIDSINARYVVVKTTIETKAAKKQVINPNQLLRDRFFGAGKIGEDMNFSWVNKDNILSTYQSFFDTYKANKSDFSREDYDEVKLMYEALDTRKNTVEKEGLSSSDNTKIASIKFKFSPMFKVNRIGAKARENEEAKE